ncbi:hypothetical protein FQA39_LY03817 [Lamprigera yunnana]|nr:hypothetical protein FQA39_LY03817 [Lamprigera yunnana]
MDDTATSVSKGVFVFNNKKLSKYKNAKSKETRSVFANSLWYKSYTAMWNTVEQKIEVFHLDLNENMFTNLLSNLVISVKSSCGNSVTEIPTKALLTGINMPDHIALFSTLHKELKKHVTPHVAILDDENCSNLKRLVESTVHQFVTKTEISFSGENDAENDVNEIKSTIKKSQCTMSFLEAWYNSECATTYSHSKRKSQNTSKYLVVVIPDFESLNEKNLQDFILIISSYLNKLPFVLIFGIATSTNAIHKVLPYRVSCKLNIQVFNSQRSTLYLNNIIENVLLSDECPFHVGNQVFNCFIDIFLYYDLSVKRFVQNFKFAMLEHFCSSSIMALCTYSGRCKDVIKLLTPEEIDTIKQLPSVSILKGSDFSKTLTEDIPKFFLYLNAFHLFLKCLHALVHDLPNAPLGNQVRDLYQLAISKNITASNEYTEALKLLSFRSKEEFTQKVITISNILEEHIANSKYNKKLVATIFDKLQNHLEKIETATTEVIEENKVDSERTKKMLSTPMDRRQLRKKLIELSITSKETNKYEIERQSLIDFLHNIFIQHLKEPKMTPFYEIFFFDDLSVKQLILGSHRSAIHSALNDPHCYLKCKCCKLPNKTTIASTLPDISILYKLHLEYGKLINLHDWLQSFLVILDPQSQEDEGDIKVTPELHARFTQAVADLEFLGFIKSYKTKANHVTRLTWGG